MTTRPTPEQWWNDMSGADRAQFLQEVAPGVRVSLEMWMKLRRDGMISAGGGYSAHSWEHYLPAPHLTYVLSQATQTGA